MGLVKLFGATRAIEFVAFAGKREGTGGGKCQEEESHQGDAIAAWPKNAILKPKYPDAGGAKTPRLVPRAHEFRYHRVLLRFVPSGFATWRAGLDIAEAVARLR